MSTTTYAPPPPSLLHAFNRVVIWLLRSPFHGLMSRTTLLLTVTGRQSKRRYTIPVRYLQNGDTLLTTTYIPRRWWRNLRGGATVDLYLAGRKCAGQAEVSTDPEQVEQGIRTILSKMPSDARFYRVHLDRKHQANREDLKLAARSNVLITIRLAENTQEFHTTGKEHIRQIS